MDIKMNEKEFFEGQKKLIREQYMLSMKLAGVVGVIMLIAMLLVFKFLLKLF